MSNVNYSRGKFFLTDGEQNLLLLDVRTPVVNKSRINSHQFAQNEKGKVVFPLEQIVGKAAKKIFQKTLVSMAEAVIYMRIVARLLRKPQIHSVLKIGQTSPLDEALTETLSLFNPANKFFKPAQVDENLLPEKKFDTLIFLEQRAPSLNVLFALKDFGCVYFVAPIQSLQGILREQAKIFPLTEQAALFELEISPPIRRELKLRTPQSQFDEKFSAVNQVVAELPDVLKRFNSSPRKKKNSCLDEYIAELIRAEKTLAEIFPMLHSDMIKFNFNLLKEFLIDMRLADDKQKKFFVNRVSRQHEILAKDLSDS